MTYLPNMGIINRDVPCSRLFPSTNHFQRLQHHLNIHLQKKRPKRWFIPLFGLLHHHVTSTRHLATSSCWIGSGSSLGSCSRGLETRHVSSPWYIFLNIFWTSTNIYTLVRLPPLPPSQHHKKRPKQRFIPLFGPLHHQVTSTHRQATSTSWISGGRLGSSRGAQDGHVSSLWYILILFLYYTNVCLVNIYHNVYHHHTTQQPKKGPNGGLYHRLGCYVTSSPWHATMSPQHVESAVGAGWQ